MSEKTILSPVEILQELSLAKTLRALGTIIEELALELCDAEEAYFWNYDASASTIQRVADGTTQACNEESFPGAAVLHCENVRFSEEPLPIPGHEAPREALASPLKYYGSPVGVIVVINPGSTDFSLLDELASMAAIVRGSVTAIEDLAAFTRRTEDLLVRAVEASHVSMNGHISRVAQLANALGGLMDLSAQSRQMIFRASQFHDVGKLILTGSSASDRERFHAQAGADYLRGTQILRELAPIVEWHHERYDGSGVLGLKGDDVSVEGWVLSLSEAFDEFQLERGDWEPSERIQSFFETQAGKHHPAALDALGGLLVSGRLEQMLLNNG